MTSPPGGERAARLRAMLGYSGRNQKDIAPLLGVSVTTLSRMENGRTPVSDDDLRRAAELSGVPPLFVAVGWAPLEAPISDAAIRLHELEARVDERLERIEASLMVGLESPATPSVTERARLAAQRLGGTPEASPETDAVPGVGD